MADSVVIYDPTLEIAAIVDLDTKCGFGPAFIGEGSREILEGFLESIPYDVSTIDSAKLRDWFEQFAGARFHGESEPTPAPGSSAVVGNSPGELADAARATMEAAAGGGDPPPPQPADTDAGATPGEASTVTEPTTPPAESGSPPPAEADPYTGPCFACNGTGRVPTGTEGVTAPCNLCKSTGHLPAPAGA